MNKAKPYLFWIVCGAILIVELIMAAVLTPTDAEGRTAADVKMALDSENPNLERLAKRAANNSPNREFDPRSEQDIKALTEDYLITSQWKQTVDACVASYERALAEIKKDLAERSRPLVNKIADTTDKNEWSDAYEKLSGELLKSLVGAGVVATVDGQSRKKDAEILTSLGLIDVKSGDAPEASEHRELTAKFRIVEKIGKLILKSPGKAKPNPVASDKADANVAAQPAETSLVSLVSIKWQGGGEEMNSKVGEYATPYHLNLVINGVEASIMAFLAALETESSPLFDVAGVQMTTQAFAPGGKRSAIPITVTLDVYVFDFTKANEAVAAGANP